MKRRIVKVGGSLLVRDDLPEALRGWIASQSAAETLVIVGGGELIDAIRRLDQIHHHDPAEIHWLCVDLLESTFQLFASWFPWKRVKTRELLLRSIQHGFSIESPTLVSVGTFYNREYAPIDVPLNWHTTTDTLAALLALETNADEVVLLKSCVVDPKTSTGQLAEQGIIDEALPAIAPRIGNLRVESL